MSSTKVELPETFKIDAVDDIYAGMRTALDSPEAIEIDGQKVKAIDFSGVQLLLAFARQCGERERDFKVNSPSEALLEAINDVGAKASLGVG